MEWILFYYNSLPDLPSACPFFSSHLMHRDFLMCNPSNTGHYKYPRFETLSYDEGCHEREVHNFLNRPDPDKYVVFYTRHTNSNGQRANNVWDKEKGYARAEVIYSFGRIASTNFIKGLLI